MSWSTEAASGGRRRWVVAALVVLAHAVVLAQIGRGMVSGRGGSGGRAAADAPQRMVLVHVTPQPASRAADPLVVPTEAAPAASGRRPPDAVAPLQHEDATAQNEQALAQEASGPQAPVTYFPRSMLSEPPTALGVTAVAFPEEVDGLVDLRVEVSLFIDEAGRVQRVRIDTPQVHWAFEHAVHAAFGGAVFTPGRIGGEAVRSWIRVEVVFDSGARRA